MDFKVLAAKPLFLAIKTYCPYCIRAIELARIHGIKAVIVELDTREDGQELHDVLKKMTGQRTVPYVFSQSRFIGGCSELEKEPQSFWDGVKKSQEQLEAAESDTSS